MWLKLGVDGFSIPSLEIGIYIDNDGRWIISQQGGYEAKGMDNLPTNEKDYVKTNGYYGYGCVCMDVVTDSARLRISETCGGESLPLSTCRQDPNVPKNP
jgi:hypothetical protein